ncbi:unnamed protein product [Ectocarpus sp. CCAP 1310/34]|nr:unnamed protein product [Ectocarpus sp. CCAP 1310/34]
MEALRTSVEVQDKTSKEATTRCLHGNRSTSMEANKIDLEPVNANVMGMECRRIVDRVFV